ncbi:MAG: threonine ammonia-lyase, biosynthetic, partial [Xanthomonadales bacterium]|nr:threonine ammonia-lyase, biosynthetic [Xanthomonadales bacterium]
PALSDRLSVERAPPNSQDRNSQDRHSHDRNARRTELFERFIPRIMQCRLEDLVSETPLQRMEGLSCRLGIDAMLKREDLQAVHSFKLRGAYARLNALDMLTRARGVICASAGNHAQGVAMAASHLGIEARVVMPDITPLIKVSAVEQLGAEVLIHGESFEEACAHALALAEETGAAFIHPYDDEDVIAGQGTIALELFRQVPALAEGTIDTLFLPIGGGGLAAGMGLMAKYVQPNLRVIGVEAEESASMRAALNAGGPVDLEEIGFFAEGVAVRRAGALSYSICSEVLDELITVTSDEICAAVQDIYEDTRAVAEPAGALGVAGLKRWYASLSHRHRQRGHGNAATVLTGANVNFARLQHIAERAAVGVASEALLGVSIPERPGSFLDFCRCIGKRQITEFNYRFAGAGGGNSAAETEDAHIFVGIALQHGDRERADLIRDLREGGYAVYDLSQNEMARTHIRHMVGGRASASDERIMRFVFPERPGALLRFLEGMKTGWNISLFHYRNHGSEYGRVLMGIQVPQEDEMRFQQFLGGCGYQFEFESDNVAYQMFVGG